MLDHRIGQFEFLDLEGNPEQVKRQLTVLARAGVDGHTVVDEGRRGTPFVLRSRVDQQDLAAGRATYGAYAALIGGDPVQLVWQDLDLDGEDFQVLVLDVVQSRLHALAWGSAGGLNPPSRAWLECDWTLLAIANEVEEP